MIQVMQTSTVDAVLYSFAFWPFLFVFSFQYNPNLKLQTGFGAHGLLGSLRFGTGFGQGLGWGWGTMFGPGFGTGFWDRVWCWACDGLVTGSDEVGDRHIIVRILILLSYLMAMSNFTPFLVLL